MSPRSWNIGLLLFFFLFKNPTGQAQVKKDKDTSIDAVKAEITILNSVYGEYIQGDQGSVHKLMHDVKLLHKGDTLYCDSAFFYTGQNSVEAFGDVAIYQADGTTAFATYMRYTGGNRKVYMSDKSGEVVLNDPDGSSLWSKEIDYNLNTKTGNYYNGGTLESESTLLTSRTGTYNLRTKDARFRGDVEVFDPEYHVISTDLGYNTETKVVRFFGPSVVTNDKSILQTRNGVYDTKTKTSHFVDRASILNEAQYIEADTLDYDQKSGIALASGQVIAIDTNQKTTLYSDIARYNEISGDLLAYGNPIMKALDKGDSLFIKADTFFSAYLPLEEDSLSSQDSLNLTADFFKSLAAANASDDTLRENVTDTISNTTDSVASTVADTGKNVIAGTNSLAARAKETGADKDTAENRVITQQPEKPAGLSDSIRQHMDSTSSTLKDQMDNLVYAREIIKEADSFEAEQSGNLEHSANTKRPARAANESTSSAEFSALSGETKTDTLETVDGTIQPVSAPTAADTLRRESRQDQADSNRQRYFTGYHNVRIFSDSLQGKCDSIRYSERDSLLRMYIDPVLWSRNSQITGTMIFLLLDSNKLREMIVPENAIMISRSGPEKANMFDQIQGETIRAFLSNNNIDSMIAEPQATSIYYAKDEAEAYIGCSEAEAERIEIVFEGEEIQTIYYRVNVTQTMTPMTEVQPAEKRLSRFSWREEERPKSLEEFLAGQPLPEPAQLLHQ